MAVLEASQRDELAAGLAERMAKRRMSVFSLVGAEVCRTHVDAALDALERDVAANQAEAMREAATAFVAELLAHELGWADLRFFARALRERLAELAPADQRQAVEDWCYEQLAAYSTAFIVQRDERLQREAARRDIERYESQLAALQVALDEKTKLLDLVRQASTPMAPVVPGILVVPLVGTFDRFRAELLTERLLDGIARERARVTILDISGVPVFDTDAAQLIIRLARSVRLLGAQVVLVGMSPDNARALVGLGVDLGEIVTCRALQDGLREALRSQRLQIVELPG